MTIESSLLCYYSNNGPERGGIITKTGPIECINVCENPEEGFELNLDMQARLDEPDVLGTFHTHPGKGSNLSFEDYQSFMNYPRVKHYIIGNDGVSKFAIRDGLLINES